MSQSRSGNSVARRFVEEPGETPSARQPERQPSNGRDASGRFAAGNSGGPGNPFARQVAKLRAALVQRVTEADMQQIAERLIVMAKSGDLAAIKLLFLYVLGKPAEAVNPDTLDIEEWRQCYQPLGQIMKEMPAAMDALPAEAACGMVAHIQPCHLHEWGAALSLPQQQIAELRDGAASPVQFGQRLREAAQSCHEETSSDNKGQDATTAPSTNGGDGTATKRKSPSTNGHRGVKNGAARDRPTGQRGEAASYDRNLSLRGGGSRQGASASSSTSGKSSSPDGSSPRKAAAVEGSKRMKRTAMG